MIVALSIPATAAGQDGLDLAQAVLHPAEPDVRPWAVTVNLEGVEFRTNGAADSIGVRPIFDRAEMNGLWADVLVWPPDGFIQYTLWAFVLMDGVWHGAGLHEFWSDRHGPAREWTGAPLTALVEDGRTNWQANWAYDDNRWAPMGSYVPRVGDLIGFALVAGDTRAPVHLESVQERTRVIVVELAEEGIALPVEEPPVPDAGPPDASLPDAGAPDAGGADASEVPEVDAALSGEDAGSRAGGVAGSSCSCRTAPGLPESRRAAPWAGVLVALLLARRPGRLWRRSPRRGARSTPELRNAHRWSRAPGEDPPLV